MPTVKNVHALLKWTFGIVPIVAGLDKALQLNILTEWSGYLAPFIPEAVGIPAETIMMIVGIIEVIAGIIVIANAAVGAYIVAIWLVLLAINLIIVGLYDIAVRDIVMAISAFSLGILSTTMKKGAVKKKM